MSFYVSDVIKDRIAKPDEIDEVDNTIQLNPQKFSIVFCSAEESYIVDMQAIDKNEKDNSYEVTLLTNTVLMEKIFFNKINAKEILIGETKKRLTAFNFLGARNYNTQYIIKCVVYMRE